jgi:phosphoglycerate dehydrogenase-like enzyme
MAKIKVAVLLNKTSFATIFTDEDYEELRKLGDVVHLGDGDPKNLAHSRECLAGSAACITSWGSPRMTAELLDVAPDLKLIVHAAGSIKPVVSDEVFRRGITITSGAPVLGIGVAETALGLIITSVKNVFECAQSIRETGWNGDPGVRARVRDMYKAKIGVVSAGNAGRHLLRLLSNFSVEVLLYDPTLKESDAKALGATLVDLDTLMRECDVISLHAPSLPETRHMINAYRLSLMKDNAVIINTARGAVIDEQALIKEASSGRIRACIDVTDPEPPAADNPLCRLPNVIMTPHIAGAVSNGRWALGNYALQEIRRFLEGKEAINPISEEQLAKLA